MKPTRVILASSLMLAFGVGLPAVAAERSETRSRAAFAPSVRHASAPARAVGTSPLHATFGGTSAHWRPSVHGPGPYRRVHGSSVRVWVGPPPVYYAPAPYWTYPPYVYRPAPPLVVVPAAPPPVYVERGPVASHVEVPPAGYWYWCQSRAAYHPAAPDCPEGWIAVAPQPASAQ